MLSFPPVVPATLWVFIYREQCHLLPTMHSSQLLISFFFQSLSTVNWKSELKKPNQLTNKTPLYRKTKSMYFKSLCFSKEFQSTKNPAIHLEINNSFIHAVNGYGCYFYYSESIKIRNTTITFGLGRSSAFSQWITSPYKPTTLSVQRHYKNS